MLVKNGAFQRHDIQARIARQADQLLLFAKHLGALRAEMAAAR